jgi:hypothetical protein
VCARVRLGDEHAKEGDDDDDDDDGDGMYDGVRERRALPNPRSSSLSLLPSIHVKRGHQHPKKKKI